MKRTQHARRGKAAVDVNATVEAVNTAVTWLGLVYAILRIVDLPYTRSLVVRAWRYLRRKFKRVMKRAAR